MTDLNISIPGITIVCGLQGGGKSHFIRYLMAKNRKAFDWGLVFTNTSFLDGNYDFVPEDFVHMNYNRDALIGLKKIHRRLIREEKKPRGFIIFDDCLFENQWKDSELLSLLTQVRHYNITVIISMQIPKGVPPTVRLNVFQVAMFEMPNDAAVKALYENYGQYFNSLAEFKRYYLESTGDHRFIFYDARVKSKQIAEKYQVCKCPAEIPKFMIKFKTKI